MGIIYSGFIGNDIADGEILRAARFGRHAGHTGEWRIAQGIVENHYNAGWCGGLDLRATDRPCGRGGRSAISRRGRRWSGCYSPGGAKLSVHVEGLSANLSGAETQAIRLLERRLRQGQQCGQRRAGLRGGDVGAADNERAGADEVRALFVHGRRDLQQRCAAKASAGMRRNAGAQAIFTQKQYCGDNACAVGARCAEII